MRGGVWGTSEEFENPGGGGLSAGYQAFGAELRCVNDRWRGESERSLTMPVDGSTERESVSTAIT